MRTRVRALRHGSLAPACGSALDVVRERGLGDQLRLGVVLQGVALLGHLHHAGWSLDAGWRGATVDDEGRLSGCHAAPGEGRVLPQELVVSLVETLFGAADVAGRGEARRVLRELVARWRQGLVAIDPDDMAVALLDAAPRLLEAWAAPARGALLAELGAAPRGASGDSSTALTWTVRLALPRARRRALLARSDDPVTLAALLAGPEAAWLLTAGAEGPAAIADSGRRRAAPGARAEVDAESARGESASQGGRRQGRKLPLSAKQVARSGGPRLPDGLARAWQQLDAGRFAEAQGELARLPASPAVRVAQLLAHQQLGELGAARGVLRRLAEDLAEDPSADRGARRRTDGEPVDRVLGEGEIPAPARAARPGREPVDRVLGEEEILLVGEIALRIVANAEDPEGAAVWLERLRRSLAGGAQGGGAAVAASAAPAAGAVARREAMLAILEAEAAWDRGAPAAMSEPLERAAAGCLDPEVAWRWATARGLQALAVGDADTAVEQLTKALRLGLRLVPRWRAARLWNELGLARFQAGDLAGAERAIAHAVHKLSSGDAQALATLALPNLAEVRLRRGRLYGVDDILARTRRENERSGNRRALGHDRELEVRHLLLSGRLGAALARCRELLGGGLAEHGRGEVLALFSARALGWLGRAEEAAVALARGGSEVLDELEPEERPAVWALAGRPAEAWREAERVRFGGLWQALLSGRRAAPAEWDALERIEPYRAARLVLDAELASPGLVPPRWQRRAIAALRHVGASDLAMRLEAASVDPWTAVAGYLGRGRAGGEELAALFAACGHGDVRVWWEDERRSEVLVAGPGGSEELIAPLGGGSLILRAPVLAPPLRVLFQLIRRDWVPSPDLPAATAVDGPLLGNSQVMREVRARVARLAGSDFPVLVLGETGTGKELVANEVHRLSRRASAPFLPVNCAGFTEGVLQSELFGHVRGAFTGADRDRAGIFETARGGTVFLDEIGDLPLSLQGNLLRLLQSGEVRRVGESVARKVDVRIVAATHRDLRAMATQGTFREDLFYRLRGGVVQLPALRERGDDILELAGVALRRASSGGRVVRLTPEARAGLLAHRWPGNVRELMQVLGTAAVLADGAIEPQHLELPEEPSRAVPGGDYHARVERFRRELLQEAIAAAEGNLAEAARRLGLSRQALSYLARELGLERHRK